MEKIQKSKDKVRIDQILCSQGLAPSRERAQALILAGKVLVNERPVEKPSERYFPEESLIRLRGMDHPYVGRGGSKLAGALKEFGINPAGKTCLDVGASTGGFTDCLLQNGAEKVYTLDSGTNQLDYRLRQDPRVKWRENFNARYLKKEDIPEAIDLIVVDVSFISLKLLIPPVLDAIPGPWEMLLLIKPQFEAGREKVEKGGLVRDEKVRAEVVEIITRFVKDHALQVHGVMPSPLQGEKGNQEYFLYAARGP
jgi:23S rRNA (cytidine1920-2'-O)/16S rRNA (cytidine1409-2'-O)-methyltransferase